MTDNLYINKQNWGRGLLDRLNNFSDNDGSVNEWSKSPVVNKNGIELSEIDAGYYGYNSSKFLFEEWDGVKWVEKPISFNGIVKSSSTVDLDLTQAYQFTISATGASSGWGFETLITSNIPFDVYAKDQVFYTANLATAINIAGKTFPSQIVSPNKFIYPLSSLHGQTITVYKQKDNPPQPILGYENIFINEDEDAGEFVAVGTALNISLATSNDFIGYLIGASTSTISSINLAMLNLGVTSLDIKIDYPSDRRQILMRVNQSQLSSTSFIATQLNLSAPISNYSLQDFSFHFIAPSGTGVIYYQKPETRNIFSWSPSAVNYSYRSEPASPSFPCAKLFSVSNNSTSQNVYPIAVKLESDNGFAQCGFHPYRIATSFNSGIQFFGTIYSGNAYPNLTSQQYVPYAFMYLTPAGNLGIGNGLDSVTDRLHVAGNVRAVNFITDANASDISLKENIYPLENVWDALKQIHPFSFTWKKNEVLREKTLAKIDPESGIKYPDIPAITSNSMPDGVFVSYNAQEIQFNLAPEAVFSDGYGKLHLRKEDLVPYLHQSLIEIDAFYQAKIADLESRILAMETNNE